MIEINRSQLEHKLEKYRQHNQDMKKTMDILAKSVLIISALEIGFGFIIFDGLTIFSLIFDILIFLLNFLVIIIILLYKSFKYEFTGIINFKAFLNSFILQLKYKKLLKNFSSYSDNNNILSDFNEALNKEKKLFNVLTLLECKMYIYLRQADYENAEKVFKQICSSKQHKSFDLDQLMLSYYAAVEDNENFIKQFDSHPEIFRKLSRANLTHALKLVTYNSIYCMQKCSYEKALELSKLDIEFYEKQYNYDDSNSMSANYLYTSASQQSNIARIYYALCDYNSANKAVAKAEEIICMAEFKIPQILINEIAEIKEKLAKTSSDVD